LGIPGDAAEFQMIRYLPQSALASGTEYRSPLRAEAARAIDAAVRGDLDRLRGSWELVFWLFNGKEQPEPQGRPVMSFAGERFTITIGGAVTEEGVVELDPAQSPKAFDYEQTKVEGRPVRVRFPGIYLLQDDVFVACVGYRGERPRVFSAEAGSENELVFYKRVRE
jgi:uncharacterized protein (TIGR03067 family)